MSGYNSELQSLPSNLDFNTNSESTISVFRCEKCGTVFQNKGGEKKCLLCNHDSLVEEQITVSDERLYIIPFIKSQKEAIFNYKKAVFWNPFVPMFFKKKSTIMNIKKIYLPSYFLEVHVDGNVSFFAGDKSKVKKNGEKVFETKRYDVLLSTNFDYFPFFVSTYSKLPEELFELVCEVKNPILQEYDDSLIKDVSVVQSDIENVDVAAMIREKVNKHCLSTIRKGIKHQLKKVQQNDLQIHSNSIKKVLCPVYLLTISYRGHDYYYLMNGENGRDYAQICFGKIEIAIFSLFLVIIISLISYLIVMYL